MHFKKKKFKIGQLGAEIQKIGCYVCARATRKNEQTLKSVKIVRFPNFFFSNALEFCRGHNERHYFAIRFMFYKKNLNLRKFCSFFQKSH